MRCVGPEWRSLVVSFFLLAAYPLTASIGLCEEDAEPQRRALFVQPEVSGIAGRLYVVERRPLGKWTMTCWQRSPFTPEGEFVPVDWDAGAKTGLSIPHPRHTQQRGMRSAAGSTTTQMHGGVVGAYLNSADLSVEGLDDEGRPRPGSGGYKMMVTPQILFDQKSRIHPFHSERSGLDLELDLQVPVAACAEKKGSLAYVSANLVLVDPQTTLKLSYILGLFAKRARMDPKKLVQHIAHDEPSHSWMIRGTATFDHPWMELRPNSATFQTGPWRGWRRFAWAIRHEHVAAALEALRQQAPQTGTSLDPADYQLRSFHLNAEITYETAPSEMGWSMRNAKIEAVE